MQNDKSTSLTGKERAYHFALDILEYSKTLIKTDEGRIVKNQLIRSATSIGANLSESKGASSALDYKKYFEIALKSGNETVYWLSIVRDAHISSDTDQTNSLISECEEICRIIGKSVVTIKNKLGK